ncbi:hypothetical protein FEP68_04518 [Burkholderia multivorans]|uniref:shufflon system plasmid conjugative transfer pilus tip adhesin PilV n=2 Tax=Burkholderia multivorans TaxID=87883 RepID=UPI002859C881|nr:shufflon system plasmid conjugative transfer pilus tip adhesin PilV [Burkholderia multivorans]MDR8931806.1 hypothetical protein [Burkholderia multivorans]
MKRSLKRQRGAVTLLETLGVLIVAGLIMPSVWGWLSDDSDNKINRATADHDKQVILAAAQYIKDNYAAVLASATASTPATITVPMLKSQYPQMFATGFSTNNPYAQTVTVRAYQPTAGTLDTIIMTSGGQAISESNMRKIAQLVGGAGGYISSTNPTVANGIYGAWGPKTIPSTPGSPGAGHMVYSLMFQNGSLVSDYLYRKAVPGHPELNQMNTAIDMGGNNVNNAATVNAQKVVAPAGNNVQVGNSYYYGDGANSAIRQNGALYVQNTAGTAAADVNAASVNASANVNASGSMWSNGQITTNSNVSLAANGASVLGGGQLQVNANGPLYLNPWSGGQTIVGGGGGSGQLLVAGRLYANEYIQPNGWAAQGGPCSPNGLIANSGSGPLFCQSGVWRGPLSQSIFSVGSGWIPWILNANGDYYASGSISCPAGSTMLSSHFSCDGYRASAFLDNPGSAGCHSDGNGNGQGQGIYLTAICSAN